ncbi:uncharacterized protein LOC107787018 isoform X1 [Nicotiana tabacum]|uniref:Uncharacterized protein LOC107787018 isoform X1 n=2 Tax=Nicotiana tabacum TaxID=4097 RepID=A0AC58TM24_TOBAC
MMRNHYFKGYSPSNFIVVAFFSLIRLYLFFLRWFVLLLVQHTNAHGLSENPKKDYFQGHESVLKGPPPSLQVSKKLIIHQREIQKNPMTEFFRITMWMQDYTLTKRHQNSKYWARAMHVPSLIGPDIYFTFYIEGVESVSAGSDRQTGRHP